MVTLVDIAPAPAGVADTVRAGLAAVVSEMDAALGSDRAEVRALTEHASKYRGKMFRPALALVSAAAGVPTFGAAHPRFGEVVRAGAVVELIHLATLVHDDVLDDAESRRGQASVNGLRGNEAAVMLGDYLFAKAYWLCSTLPVRSAAGVHSATRVGEVTAQVCAGELTQLSNRNNDGLGLADYYRIIEEKTAALIGVACELGATHAGADGDDVRALASFGRRIGTAFQIRDDVLDLVGEEGAVGKPLGRDLELGKMTLPLIHHLSVANGSAGVLRAAVRGGGGVGRGEVARMLGETGSIEHALEAGREQVRLALASLDAVPTGGAREYLAGLAGAVMERSA